MKQCTAECNYQKKYNDDWCICMHPSFKFGKKQMSTPCLVELVKEKESESE